MSNSTGSQFEQLETVGQSQASSSLQDQVSQIRQEQLDEHRSYQLTERAKIGSLSKDENIEGMALRSFPGNKEAQLLVIAEQNGRLTESGALELNAWRKFPQQQQVRERELFIKECGNLLNKEEEGELTARTKFPGNERALALFKKQSGGHMTEQEQQEIAALLKSVEPAPVPPTPDVTERGEFQPAPLLQSLEMTNPYPRLTPFERKEKNQSSPFSDVLAEGNGNWAPYDDMSTNSFSRAVNSLTDATPGSTQAATALGFQPNQADYTTKLLELFPREPEIVRLFNQYLLGKISKDSEDYLKLVKDLLDCANHK